MALFFLASSNFSNASIKLEKKTLVLKNVIQARALRLSKKDENIAKNIIEYFKNFNSNYINYQNLKNIKKQVSRSKLFKDFENWISELEQISSQKSYLQSIETCRSIEKKHYPHSVKGLLNNKLLGTCHKYTLDLIYKELENKSELNNKIKTYLYTHFTYFLNSSNSFDFYNFIDKISKNEIIYEEISFLIIKQVIDLNLEVNHSLLSRVSIDPELTHFLQKKGLKNKQTPILYYQQLKHLTNIIKDKISVKKSNISQEIEDLLGFHKLNKKYLPYEKTIERILYLGRSLSREDYPEKARTLFEYAISNSNGEEKNEAIFQNLWTFINNKQYSSAHSFIISQDLLTNFDNHSARLKFWISHSIMKNKDYSAAISYYTKLINAHSLTYYAIMATKNIQTIKNNSLKSDSYYLDKIEKTPNGVILSMNDLTYYGRNKLKRLKLWGQENFIPFIQAEYNDLSRSDVNDIVRKSSGIERDFYKSNIALLSAALLGSVNNYVASFKILYREISRENLDLSKTLLGQLFPKPFLGKIRKVASEGVDPIILLSLIRQESAFNPEAKSHVGATGLMQLMPSTARTIERKLKNRHLQNPTINLKVGSKYFEYLYNKYEGNLVYTLSAYNAGESRVKRWRSKYFKSDSILHNIENIPFNETRNYVKYIFRNIFFYKLMHEKLKMVDSSKTDELFDIALNRFKR